MGNKRQPGNKPVIKTNLKTSDRITLIYNDKEVEMSIADSTTVAELADVLGSLIADLKTVGILS